MKHNKPSTFHISGNIKVGRGVDERMCRQCFISIEQLRALGVYC